MRPLRALAVLLIVSSGAIAQTDARPQFDVASIKPAAPGQSGTFVRIAPGGGSAANAWSASGG